MASYLSFKNVKILIIIAISALNLGLDVNMAAQAGREEYLKNYKLNILTFKNEICDLGTFSEKDGPQTCVFKFKNENDVPIAIHLVTTSCGCAKPSWSKKPVQPGGTGIIKVTYVNDSGPAELDKLVTVYASPTVKTAYLKIIGKVTAAGKSPGK